MDLETLVQDQATDGKNVSNFLKNTDKKGSTNQSKSFLHSRLSLLWSYWKNIFQRHRTLCQHEEELKKEDYLEQQHYERYEDAYTTAKATILDRLEALTTPTRIGSGDNAALHLISTHSSLLKVALPRFSGVQTEWETFKERFSAMVKNDTGLSYVLKLQHLLSCLEGEPARRIKNLQVIGANFTVAWTTLTGRYDNKRVRLSTHMPKLLSMPAATARSSQEISRLLDAVSEAERVFTLLERLVQHWDDWFCELVCSRLDEQTREDWEKTLEGKTDLPTYANLVSFLEGMARTLESTQPFHTTPSPAKNFNTKVSKHISAHQANAVPAQQYNWPTCSLCEKQHFISYCPTFLQWSSKRKLAHLQEASLCANCLCAGYTKEVCPSKIRCKVDKCSARHHTLLHDACKGTVTTAATSKATNSSDSQLRVYTTQWYESYQQGNVKLLATANIILSSPTGSSLQIRALIDPAAEGSFLTERVVRMLSLPRTKTEFFISGVGAEGNITSNSSTTAILRSNKDPNFSLNFSAIVLDRLTALLPKQQCAQGLWPHLQGLDLADQDFSRPARVDCILGTELFPALIKSALRKGLMQEPVAQDSVFGWIITGPTTATANNRRRNYTLLFHDNLPGLEPSEILGDGRSTLNDTSTDR